MLLQFTHQTDLSYSELISETVMELRVCPRQEQDQHRLSFDLAIGPPTAATSYFDWLGNQVHAFTLSAFHRQVRIIATSVVQVDRASSAPRELGDRWPVELGDDYSIYDFLQFGGPIVDSPRLRRLLESLGPRQGMPLGELAMGMLALIHDRFVYEQGVTTVASPITDVLEHGRGVCQDFTHLMIGLARAAGIPARYVSGLLHSGPAQLRGAAQTHAWCELLFPSAGWVGFDPTNNCAVGPQFAKVAVGRHYQDVTPHRGVFRGSAAETMEIAVRSETLAAVPAQLAAEKFGSLAIRTYTSQDAEREALRALDEQRQQQQQ